MRKFRFVGAIALGVATTAASFVSLAASVDTFRNGQSVYGQPSTDNAATRVVELGTTTAINVSYGETVAFRSGGQTFSWPFNGLVGRGIDITKIAPAAFAIKPLGIFVERSSLNRN